MCECLAYEDGTMWPCEACGPRWLEYEHKLSERPVARSLAEAIEEARKAVKLMRAAFFTELYGAPVAAIEGLLLALDADDRLAKAEAALRRVEAQETAVDGLRPELYGHAVCIARRYFSEKGEVNG